MKTLLLLLLSATTLAATTLRLPLGTIENEVGFLAVGKPSALKIRGEVKKPEGALNGNLVFEGGNVSGMAVFALDSLSTGIGLRDSHMKEKYLQTQTHPEAKLKLTSLVLPESFVAGSCVLKSVPFTGQLELHGKTNPVSGEVDVTRKEKNITMDFRFKVKITDYGIEIPSYLGIKVVDEVNVSTKLAGALVAS